MGWYVERSRYNSAKAAWELERVEFVRGVMSLGAANAVLHSLDARYYNSPREFSERERLKQLEAVHHFLNLVNYKRDVKNVISSERPADDEAEFFNAMAYSPWNNSGRPSTEDIEKLIGSFPTSSTVIKDREVLEETISDLQKRSGK